MKLHEWGLLLLAYVLFLVIGAALFYFLERGQEVEQAQRVLQLRSDIQDEMMYGENGTTVARRTVLLDRISQECGVDITNTSRPPAKVWNEYNSFFFCFTVVTTIGYGHIAPSTTLGRVACILYALIGIPFNGILLKNISDLFSKKVIGAQQRIKRRRCQTKLEVFVDTLFYLFPAVLIFFLIPAGIFIILEDWSFPQAIYYAFVTLTTIGFGDLVAGKVRDPENPSAFIWIYKIALVIWILIGLGYLLMVLDFIGKALYSKKILGLEKKLVNNIAKTRDKLKKNVSKEILQFRKILNELALNRRMAPTPRGPVRTQSFPNLAAGGSDGRPGSLAEELPALRRGGSEPCLEEQVAVTEQPAEYCPLLSTVSTSDLTAAVAAAAAGQRPAGAEGGPAGEMPTVDSAIDLLLKAKVTLEWDIDSSGSDHGDGGGDSESHQETGVTAPTDSPTRSSRVLRRLGHAWTNRPSFFHSFFPHWDADKEPRERVALSTRGTAPSPGSQRHGLGDRQRRTTTNLGDLLRLMRVAAATRRRPKPVSSSAAAAAAGRGRRASVQVMCHDWNASQPSQQRRPTTAPAGVIALQLEDPSP